MTAKIVGCTYLLGAWLCALGWPIPGLCAFILGGLPSITNRDVITLGFMAANIVGLTRLLLR